MIKCLIMLLEKLVIIEDLFKKSKYGLGTAIPT